MKRLFKSINKNCTLTPDGYIVIHTPEMYERHRRFFYHPDNYDPYFKKRVILHMCGLYHTKKTCESVNCTSPIVRRLIRER